MSQEVPGSPGLSSPTSHGSSRKRKAHISSSTILLIIFTNGVSFMGGSFYASNAHASSSSILLESNLPKHRQLPSRMDACPPPVECPKCPQQDECPPGEECSTTGDHASSSQRLESRKFSGNNPFPDLVHRFAAGMAYATQENFTKTYDLGVPIDVPIKEDEKGVLILYNTPESLPFRAQQGMDTIGGGPISAEEATQNCDHMNVLFSYHEGRRKQCLAIVPQYEAFHVQKWMRVPEKGPGSSDHPLRMVPRGYSMNGLSAFHTPKHEKHTKKHWKMLETYFESIDDIVAELTPLVKNIAHNNAIIVMVCNFGQSQLLINFACAARAKGLDVSSVLVFATDEETRELAASVGLNVYFDKRNFETMPTKAAKLYGDGVFTSMMLSKVICVHMASMLGVDILFQDVDVIWFKNPLTFFHEEIANTSLANFDAYFQDDGSRSLRFAPYCANSGFYYLRANDMTRYFMTSLLMQSDLVLRSFSHQSVMISILAEHSSLLGLKVKVLDPFVFPSGFIYHRKKGRGPFGNFFVDLYKGKHDPYIFHMSWTENKLNKILFYRQLDQWYLQDKCMDRKVSDIPGLEPEDGKFVDTCCSAEPLFSCHFQDKPSSKPCRGSPSLDKKGKSYW